MNATRLTSDHFVRQPWRNGGGSTTELAREGDGDRWLWRLSIAQVERSGPFSDFAGYERTIVLIEGDGMELEIDRALGVTLAEPYRPFTFDGGDATTCRLLGGPVKDLNLIVDRERAVGSVEMGAAHRFGDVRIESRWALAYALHGKTRAMLPGFDCALARGDLLRVDEACGTRLELAAIDDAALVALVRIDAR